MSLTKVICFLTYGAVLLLGCHERDGGGDPYKAAESPKEPSASDLKAVENGRPNSEESSDPHRMNLLAEEEHRYPAGPDHSRPTLQLEPMDMMTAVGDSPLHVLVSRLRADDANDVLDRVAGAVSLRTWPELMEVATTSSQ